MKQVYLKVTDHPNLIKDPYSKALMCIDVGAVARHEQRLARVTKELSRDEELNRMKAELEGLKKLVAQLIENK